MPRITLPQGHRDPAARFMASGELGCAAGCYCLVARLWLGYRCLLAGLGSRASGPHRVDCLRSRPGARCPRGPARQGPRPVARAPSLSLAASPYLSAVCRNHCVRSGAAHFHPYACGCTRTRFRISNSLSGVFCARSYWAQTSAVPLLAADQRVVRGCALHAGMRIACLMADDGVAEFSFLADQRGHRLLRRSGMAQLCSDR